MKQPPELTESQRMALFAIEHGDHRPFLLHGVTGSGKTEIFFRLAQKALEQKECSAPGPGNFTDSNDD